MGGIIFIDLFDWEKEADRDAYYLLAEKKASEEEWQQWEEEEKKKLPAKVTILTSLKKKENELKHNSPSF